MEGLAKALEHDIMINISLASDQEAYRMRRESLEGQWLKKKDEIERLDDLISDKVLRAGRIDAFIEELQSFKAITEFSAQAWGVMVESVKVRRDREIDFSFIDWGHGQGIKDSCGNLGGFCGDFVVSQP